MRIYVNPVEAAKETERDLWEMGIRVHPQTMQDKDVANDPKYETTEMTGYGFKVNRWSLTLEGPGSLGRMLNHFFHERSHNVMAYILQEFRDRTCGQLLNPGNSWKLRKGIWNEFMHQGKFAYTYAERFAPQLYTILGELKGHPDTRQAIITMHSNIQPLVPQEMLDDGNGNAVANPAAIPSVDMFRRGGGGRIPCSMYYQVLRRRDEIELIYTMRSCDLLVHFPVDLALALMLQDWFCDQLECKPGMFTYFAGSLHAYAKDMHERGIF